MKSRKAHSGVPKSLAVSKMEWSPIRRSASFSGASWRNGLVFAPEDMLVELWNYHRPFPRGFKKILTESGIKIVKITITAKKKMRKILYCTHITLPPRVYPSRVRFCEWLLEKKLIKMFSKCALQNHNAVTFGQGLSYDEIGWMVINIWNFFISS